MTQQEYKTMVRQVRGLGGTLFGPPFGTLLAIGYEEYRWAAFFLVAAIGVCIWLGNSNRWGFIFKHSMVLNVVILGISLGAIFMLPEENTNFVLICAGIACISYIGFVIAPSVTRHLNE